MEKINSKKVWTEEERLKLAAELDTKLDDYINQLEKKTYTEGWSEDCWEEEMDKHPFFMTNIPESGEELSPLVEGLQQLKYGEDDNTPEELANNYKDDGNFNYKHKKYRMAIISYTEGIKTKCENKELMAQLYNNRAASNYMLQNYRSSLNDNKLALKLKPDYVKCLERAANCCFHIKDYDQCIELCKRLLILCPNDKTASDLEKQAIILQKDLQRNKRKSEKAEKMVHMKQLKVLSAIMSRGINLVSSSYKNVSKWEDMEYPTSNVQERLPSKVYLDENNQLVWPVIIVYTEMLSVDSVMFCEDITMQEMLQDILSIPQEWDKEHRYNVNNIAIYFEATDRSTLHPVDITQSLRNILTDKRFVVCCGTPVFWIFLKEQTKPETIPRLSFPF